jgi:hypothetical protein
VELTPEELAVLIGGTKVERKLRRDEVAGRAAV